MLLSEQTLLDFYTPDPVVIEYLSQIITQAIEEYGLYHQVNNAYCFQVIRNDIADSISVMETLYPEIIGFEYTISYHLKSRKFIISPLNNYSTLVCNVITTGRKWFVL